MYKALPFIFYILFFPSAYATDPGWGSAGFSTQETRLSFRGIGEAWSDSTFGSVYRSDRFFGSIGLSHRFHYHYAAYIEGGFTRVDGNNDQTALQLIPMSIGGSLLFGSNKRVEPFLGLGVSFVNFLEQVPNATVSGTKMGMDIRTGVRIGTRFLRRTQHPLTPSEPSEYRTTPGIKQLDVEIMVGQRIHQMFGIGDGFDLSATRLGVGLQLRL